MLLQFCDKCGKPLSESAIARGDAIERADANGETELVCSVCIAAEQKAAAAPKPTVPEETGVATGPLGEYHKAVWNCESCGIPVNALDLIEGRASRAGGRLICSRCLPVSAKHAPTAAPVQAAPSAPSRPAPVPRAPLPRAVPSVRHTPSAAQEFVAAASKDQRKPVLPIVMFAIVLPLFAVSVYFAITTQQKLAEVTTERNRVAADDDRRSADREERRRNPDNDSAGVPPLRVDLPPEQPANGTTQPDTPASPDPAPTPRPQEVPPIAIPADVAVELVQIERDLAAPVIRKLQSDKLNEVWEGLITAGSRRLVAARPHVRALLADQDDDTRLLACRVSGMLNDKDALPTLSRMAEFDPDEQVRIEARQARDRMMGTASREVRDMTEAELEELLNELRAELERRRGRND